VVVSRRNGKRFREEAAMAKVLRCRDLGMNCPKEMRAENEEELLKIAAEHAEKDHGVAASSIPPSILAMVKAAIKDE
jgi:predicted small metal-binding protein